MRFVIKNIVTPEDLSLIPRRLGPSSRVHISKVEDNLGVKKILDSIRDHYDFTIKPESYYVFESRSEGHPWHVDTGSENHMAWCTLGGSMIINDSFTGGELLYECKEEGIVKTGVREKFDMWIHTSDEKHKVNPSQGKREAFLLFI